MPPDGSPDTTSPYINHDLCAGDNGRVVGYDNQHGVASPPLVWHRQRCRLHQLRAHRVAVRSGLAGFKDIDMKSIALRTATEQEFFKRGRALAQRADAGQPLPEEHTVSFQEPAELLKLLTATRLELLWAIMDEPASISGLARRLHRDRSAVKRDVDQLARAGMVLVESRVLPGHGRMKEVRSSARSFRLEAVLT